MKRLLYLFGLLLFCMHFLISCTKPYNEEIIRKEFKDYIKLNFDNPDDLKEIVEIIPYDTLSYASVRNLAFGAFALADTVEEGYDINSEAWGNLLEEFVNKCEQYGIYNISTHNRNKLSNLLQTYTESVFSELGHINAIRQSKQELQARLDSMSYQPAIYVYKINYRVHTGGSTKLKNHYSYIDSLNGFISINPDYNHKDVVCEEYGNLLRDVDNFISTSKQLGDKVNASMENLKEARNILYMEF